MNDFNLFLWEAGLWPLIRDSRGPEETQCICGHDKEAHAYDWCNAWNCWCLRWQVLTQQDEHVRLFRLGVHSVTVTVRIEEAP